MEDGRKHWYKIPRCRCEHCGALHRMIPDFLIPFKHYETEVIGGVLEKVITPDTAPDDGPCEMTMLRWLRWFEANAHKIEAIIRSVVRRDLDFSDEFLKYDDPLLPRLRTHSPDWLKIVIRFIYNSGIRLDPGC